jgi:hypothetical protein
MLPMKERSGRNILSRLTADGILGSNTPKGPVSLRFDSESARIVFPRIYAEFSHEDERPFDKLFNIDVNDMKGFRESAKKMD